jgi:hypothetical protein
MATPSAHTSFNNNSVFSPTQTQATCANSSSMTDGANNEARDWSMKKSSTSLEPLGNHAVIKTSRQTDRIFYQEASWGSSSTYDTVDDDALLHALSKAEAEAKAEAESNSEPAALPNLHLSRTSDRPLKPYPTSLPVRPLPRLGASPTYSSSSPSTPHSRTNECAESNKSPRPVVCHIRNLPKSNLFVEELPSELESCPYFLSFIGCRIAVANNISLKYIMRNMDISHVRNCPVLFWNSFDECLQTLPRDPSAVWAAAEKSFEGYTFKGKVVFESAIDKPVFKLDLLPIQAEDSCLFQRMFGSDRFLYLTFPSFQEKPERFTKDEMSHLQDQWKIWMSDFHSFLGRTWRVFHVEPLERKVHRRKPGVHAAGTRVILFAIEGAGINRVMSVGDMINEFFNFAKNKDQNFCKAFARLDLGLSRTIPTLAFKPSQIKHIRDVRADITPEACDFNDPHLDWDEQCDEHMVMNDGCARVSVGAALKIWQYYRTATGSTDPLPSAFQGRIGGAKGMWMISAEPHTRDPVHLETWIEVTESQRKFDPVSDEEADDQPYACHRLTFNYLKHSLVSGSSNLYTSFISILVDRGVQRNVLAEFIISQLDRERRQLLEMLCNPVQLHDWISKRGSATSPLGILTWQAALPSSVAEKVKLLLRSGFCPVQSPFLARSLKSFFRQEQLSMEEKLRIPLGKSTFLFGLADPTDILEPGEVHVQFSKPFLDESDRRMYVNLKGEEVLVARQPAYRRSDIQKMRVVSHPSLSYLVDVIVFPRRGKCPAARKLQGGDYDGDTFWTCWEPLLVAPFRNAPAPLRELDCARYGIDKDTRKIKDLMNPHDLQTVDMFLKEALDFRMTQSLLGRVTVFADKVAYLENCVHSDTLTVLYDVRDLLVDAPKQAYRFGDNDFDHLVRHKIKCKNPGVPAYKQAIEARQRSKAMGKEHKDILKHSRHNPDNIIDFLYFNVIRKHNTETQQAINAALPKEDDDDQDLQLPFLQLRGKEDAILNHELDVLLREIDKILRIWNSSFVDKSELSTEKWNRIINKCYNKFRSLVPSAENISRPQIAPLLSRYLGPKHPTIWETIRSSALYTTYPKNHSFVWHMAGRELVRLKAGTNANTYNVIPSVFANFKTKSSKVVQPEDEESDSGGVNRTNSYSE